MFPEKIKYFHEINSTIKTASRVSMNATSNWLMNVLTFSPKKYLILQNKQKKQSKREKID